MAIKTNCIKCGEEYMKEAHNFQCYSCYRKDEDSPLIKAQREKRFYKKRENGQYKHRKIGRKKSWMDCS